MPCHTSAGCPPAAAVCCALRCIAWPDKGTVRLPLPALAVGCACTHMVEGMPAGPADAGLSSAQCLAFRAPHHLARSCVRKCMLMAWVLASVPVAPNTGRRHCVGPTPFRKECAAAARGWNSSRSVAAHAAGRPRLPATSPSSPTTAQGALSLTGTALRLTDSHPRMQVLQQHRDAAAVPGASVGGEVPVLRLASAAALRGEHLYWRQQWHVRVRALHVSATSAPLLPAPM